MWLRTQEINHAYIPAAQAYIDLPNPQIVEPCKPFLIKKLQYPKYRFLQKYLYRKVFRNISHYISNSKSFIFTSSPAKKNTECKII